jgi:glucose/arabinose dehydrogenase
MSKRWIRVLLRLCAAPLCAALACAVSLAVEPPLTTQIVASGLTKPLLVTHAPGDYARIFIVEQNGKIKIFKNGSILPTPFLDVQSLMGGSETYLEYGLLGLAFHPGYAQNGIFYIMYTVGNSNLADPVIYRYHVSANPDVADPASASLILRISYTQKQHRSGWMEFGRDGYFYCATGDGGENDPTNAGADLTVLKGKILRLDVDGADNIPGNADDDTIVDPNRNYSIPPNNPFVFVAGAMGEIWHYGLRNAWRDSFDTATGDLYIGDVGQNQREEISYARTGIGGIFYGWRCWEGSLSTGLSCGSPPSTPTGPIYEYDHTVGISVTGGYVYRGCAIPDLGGTYIFGDWSGGKIFSFRYFFPAGVTNFQDRTATLGGGGGLTSFGTDSYGEIYYTRGSGEVRKIVPVTAQEPDCNGNGKRDACDVADRGSLDVNHNGIPDECECIATTEVCDGLDNDCDGTVDNAAVPPGRPSVMVAPSAPDPVLSWTPVASATAYDIVGGDVALLRSTTGDFTAAVDQCAGNNQPGSSLSLVGTPAAGDAFFYIVRPVNCGGHGTYDEAEPSQVAPRDAEINAAPASCP